MKGVSIIICCYNSALRISETLKCLSSQTISANINCEIILVNNCSTDNTVQTAYSEWAKFGRNDIKLKVVEQNTPGLSYAREKGFKESCYEYLIFCDDDNWLADDYVETAFKLLETWQDAGIIGGWGTPHPEIIPPIWFNKYSTYYATGKQYADSGIVQGKGMYVYGAGAVIRKSILQKLNDINFQYITTDRQKEKLSSGGDVELCYAVNLLGNSIGYSDELRFVHFIPSKRLSDNYLLNLVYQFGYCNTLHRPYYWLFNPELSKIKKKWQWVLLVSIHIYIISLIKFIITSKSEAAFVAKVNLKHATGRLMAIIKINTKIEKKYYFLIQKFSKT